MNTSAEKMIFDLRPELSLSSRISMKIKLGLKCSHYLIESEIVECSPIICVLLSACPLGREKVCDCSVRTFWVV